MLDRCIPIFNTYWRQAVSSWSSGVSTVSVAVLFPASILLTLEKSSQGWAVIAFLGSSVFAALLWNHFRQLLINPRRIVYPRYTFPQILVFLSITAVFLLAWPCAVASLAASPPLPLTALCLASFALAGCCAITLSPALYLIWIALCVAFWMGTNGSFQRDFLDGRWASQSLVLIATATMVIAIAIARASRMTEDNRTFTRIPRTLENYLTRRRRPYLSASRGSWAAARRWTSLKPMSLYFWLFGLSLYMAMDWAMHGTTGTRRSSSMFVSFIAWAPGFFICQSWLPFRRYLALELMRPGDRRNIFKGLGLTVAAQIAALWALFATALIIETYLRIYSGPPRSVAATIAASFGCQIFALGAGFSVLRRTDRRPLAILIYFIGAMLVSFGAVIPATEVTTDIGRAVALGFSLILAAIGLYLIRRAYRLWLTTELG
jgi:hypothetical protein